ncbi:MAG: inositol monophosphatase [Phycisphaeraceae bacterium]
MREVAFIERLLPEIGAYVAASRGDRVAMQVASKADPVDLITEIDREAQRRIEQAIAAEFPNDKIVAEENGMDRFPDDRDARCWIIDPIDGTHNFVHGALGAFGVSIAFAHRNELQAGGVAFPELAMTFTAQRGGGAWRNGSPTRVSEVAEVSLAQVEMDFGRPDYRERIVAMSPGILGAAGQIRCHGSAVFGLCSVAGGYADAYLHAGLKVWDWAAAALIVSEAGGTVTNLQGESIRPFDIESMPLLASNGRIHQDVLRLLR